MPARLMLSGVHFSINEFLLKILNFPCGFHVHHTYMLCSMFSLRCEFIVLGCSSSCSVYTNTLFICLCFHCVSFGLCDRDQQQSIAVALSTLWGYLLMVTTYHKISGWGRRCQEVYQHTNTSKDYDPTSEAFWLWQPWQH